MRTDPDAQAMQTPRTDALMKGRIFYANCGDMEREVIDHARELEREVATLRERLAQSRDGEALPPMPEPSLIQDEREYVYAYDEDDMRAYARAALSITATAAQTDAIRMGLEAAAKVCAEHPASRDHGSWSADGAVEDCAARIRAIKPDDVLGGAK